MYPILAQVDGAAPTDSAPPVETSSEAGNWLSNLSLDRISYFFESFGPLGKYLAAILIFLIGRAVARGVGKMVERGLTKTGLDDNIGKHLGSSKGSSPARMVGMLVYYVLLLFVLIFALGFVGLNEVTDPLKDLLSKFLGYIPALIGAGIIVFLGVVLARVVKALLENVLTAAKIDERLGNATEGAPITNALSTAAFSLVLLLIAPAALDTLGIKSISEPIRGIVEQILGAVPNILVAGVLLAIGAIIAGVAQRLVANLLEGTGVNAYPNRLGLGMPESGNGSVSHIAGLLTYISILVLLGSAAIERLDVKILNNASEGFVGGYFNVLLAVLIFGGGWFGAKFAYNALDDMNKLLAQVVRIAILFFVGVIALERTGIAPDLTGMPYHLTLYALAAAIGIGGAIAIGLGSKDYIARWLENKEKG